MNNFAISKFVANSYFSPAFLPQLLSTCRQKERKCAFQQQVNEGMSQLTLSLTRNQVFIFIFMQQHLENHCGDSFL